MNHYDKKFFDKQQSSSFLSAKEIFPFIFKYIQPKSAIDIGCGVGAWLKVLETEYDIKDILGVDGEYVAKDSLLIDTTHFQSHDLINHFKSPKKYDIAISVEVGEHLPDSSADNLVKSLTDASDIIIFSAAIVNQSGTYHINEQYPEYWAKKFIANGYTPIDYIRKEIWNNENVEWWYRQNLIMYVNSTKLTELHTDLLGFAKLTDADFLTRIHPYYFNAVYNKYLSLQTINGFIRHKLYPLKQLLNK